MRLPNRYLICRNDWTDEGSYSYKERKAAMKKKVAMKLRAEMKKKAARIKSKDVYLKEE